MRNYIRTSLCAIAMLSLTSALYADGVGIADTEITPDASAMLEVASTNRGVLFPRMSTAQRLAITSAATGLLVFDTDDNAYYFKNVGGWEVLVSGNASPPGEVTAFAGSTNNIPDGWLLCDGSAMNSSNYPALHVAIGTAWGDASDDGDPSTDFCLPDLRGHFLRGVDHGAGNDPDSTNRFNVVGGNINDAVGSAQSDEFAEHTHTISSFRKDWNAPTGPHWWSVFSEFQDGQNSGSAGGTETRPLNKYVNYIIKY